MNPFPGANGAKAKRFALAYETVEKRDRSLALLVHMSEEQVELHVQKGANYLEKPL